MSNSIPALLGQKVRFTVTSECWFPARFMETSIGGPCCICGKICVSPFPDSLAYHCIAEIPGIANLLTVVRALEIEGIHAIPSVRLRDQCGILKVCACPRHSVVPQYLAALTSEGKILLPAMVELLGKEVYDNFLGDVMKRGFV